ncbi:MAG: ABC transporter ATP-binding protein [Planctomycetaceae bacterium]|jgi:iron complex transport system ATP-binding protein|nr:ABC transporter ATP-binding protein [Planctomycetaceae bacterium]
MLISVQNLTYRVGNKTLLDDLSFDVQAGEYLTIIGPNGAGKSTLLKCLDNILSDWSGTILLDQVPLQQISPIRLARRIAFVQQSVLKLFSFTVRQLVEMGRYPHLKWLSPLTEEDQQIVHESMTAMGILHLADRTIETLSGGEMQKVHLATALVQQADILFLDEPTTYLDYKYQSEIGRLLRTINQQQHKTIIEVTHDVNRALLDATHVMALSEGKIVFDGSPGYLMDADHLRNIYGIDFQFVDHPSLPLKIVVPGT